MKFKRDKYYYSQIKDLILAIVNSNPENTQFSAIWEYTQVKISGKPYEEFSIFDTPIQTALNDLIEESYLQYDEYETNLYLSAKSFKLLERGGFVNEAKANSNSFWIRFANRANVWLTIIAALATIFSIITLIKCDCQS